MAEFSEGTETLAELAEEVKKLEVEEGEDSEAVKKISSPSDESAAAEAAVASPQYSFVLPRFDDKTPLSMDSAVEVLYCGVCTLPLEYCVYGQRYEECIVWRQNNL